MEVDDLKTLYEQFATHVSETQKDYEAGKFDMELSDLSEPWKNLVVPQDRLRDYLDYCEFANASKALHDHDFVKKLKEFAKEKGLTCWGDQVLKFNIGHFGYNLLREELRGGGYQSWRYVTGFMFVKETQRTERIWFDLCSVDIFKLTMQKGRYEFSNYDWGRIKSGIERIVALSKE